jgi:membrane-associated phospholipid phosphatase
LKLAPPYPTSKRIPLFLAFRTKSYFKWFFVVVGGLLIISTIYLRYHYMVDLIAGALLAFAVIKFEPYIYALMEQWFVKVEKYAVDE